MDNEQLEKLIYERFKNLQPEIQAVIMDASYDQKIADISRGYSLTPEQMSNLELNTTFVLLGQTHPNDYKNVLVAKLGLPANVVSNIVNEVDTKILKNVKGLIIKNFEDDEKGALSQDLLIDPRFSTLPVDVQNAIASSDYQKKLYDIGTEYKLPINKMASLEDITVKFITASISPTQYEGELALATDLPADKVSEIASKVNEQILKNIRTQMQKELTPQIADDEVPLPPYVEKVAVEVNMPIVKQEPKPAPIISKMESDIYSNAGIEFTDDTNAKDLPPAPPSNPSIDMFANKLNKMVLSSNTVSDHSLPKVTAPATPAPSVPVSTSQKAPHDPYHEPIN